MSYFLGGNKVNKHEINALIHVHSFKKNPQCDAVTTELVSFSIEPKIYNWFCSDFENQENANMSMAITHQPREDKR